MFFLLSLLTVCLLSSSDVSASVPADNQSSYQTAFLYFLPDYEPKQIDEAEARGCTKLGYTYTRSNCASPRILKDKCPAGNAYKTCFCAGSPDCTGSTSSSNPYPSSTGASKTSSVNCAGSTLYTWTCSGCDAYALSSCPSHGNCTKCCNGYYKLNSCSSGYHVSGNACEEDCNSSSSDWCGVHSTCHGDCCTDGTIEPCDTRCGGSGCEPVTPSDPCSGVSCPSGQTCTNGRCVSTGGTTGGNSGSCVSGGSSSCTGQTTSCTSSQRQTSSCKDCDGVTHYTCRNVVRGDTYFSLNNDYHCWQATEDGISYYYVGGFSCNGYCDVDGKLLSKINNYGITNTTAPTNCVGQRYDSEEECQRNRRDASSNGNYPGYYPQGGANNCLAYEN